MPFSQDLLTRIVNIKFPTGLAVEFDNASYSTIENGIPDFSKAVISFWFRAPKKSIIRTNELAAAGGESDVRALFGVMPLIMFGRPQQQQDFEFLYGEVSSDPVNHPYQQFYDWQTVGQPYDVGPSFIGLVVNNDEAGTFDLGFRLQMATYGNYAAVGWVVQPPAIWHPGGPGDPPRFIVSPKDTAPTIAYGPPEFFYVQTALSLSPLPPDVWLKPDAWHHLLLSFDLTGGLSIGDPFASSSCQMWYAIDDKDYRGPENLQPNRELEDNLGSNTILTDNIYGHSGEHDDDYLGTPVPAPSGSYNPQPVPATDQPFGIPGTLTYVNDVCVAELAEFQMWTGVTLDTAEESNRRAFVDKDGFPVAPIAAEELLHKRPDILLHGSSNWINGKNTGSVGVDGDGVLIPAGQFKPMGSIVSYKPEPSLHGPQSPAVRNARL